MQFSISIHVRVKQAHQPPIPNPQSLTSNPFEPGTVIALKTSHCIHIAFRSHATPGAMWVVIV